MFEQHFALRENPFLAGHQSKFVYPSPEHQEALAHLRYGIENREPFVLITGEVGTGKTTALYEVLDEWKSRAVVAVVTNSALTRTELLEEIGLRLGFALPPALSKPQLLSHLERHLLALRSKGERAILLLDEAQNLDRELLEEIRLLSNLEAQGDKLLQVFLLGQPELDARLMQTELRQLRQRVAVHYRLNPLSAEDTERYIHHRIAVAGGYGPRILPHETCAEVYALSHGIPREINQLCAQALLNAFVDDAVAVRPEHVRAAAHEIEFESVLPGAAESAPGPAVEPRPHAEPQAQGVAAPGSSDLPRPAAGHEHAWETEEAASPEAVEHEPSGPVVPATDEANWEAWVRSLMISHPEEPPAAVEPHRDEPVAPVRMPEATVAAHAHEVPPQPAVVPEPIHVPEPGPEPSRVPEPVIVPEPNPDPTPVPQPSQPAEPLPEPTRAVDRPVALSGAPSRPIAARAVLDSSWRPPLWTPERSGRPERGRGGRVAAMVEEDRERRGGGWLATAALLAAVAMSVVLLFRFGPMGRWLEGWFPRAAATGPATAPASPGVATQPDGSAPAGSPPPASSTQPGGESVPAPSSPPAAVPVAPEPSPARTPAKATPRASTWSLVVGTFMDEAKARDESQRLGNRTGLPARVRAIPESSGVMYQVALGAFPGRASAESAAGNLVGRGLVAEARVVAQRRRVAAPPSATP